MLNIISKIKNKMYNMVNHKTRLQDIFQRKKVKCDLDNDEENDVIDVDGMKEKGKFYLHLGQDTNLNSLGLLRKKLEDIPFLQNIYIPQPDKQIIEYTYDKFHQDLYQYAMKYFYGYNLIQSCQQ
ncbi:hypothetical protein PPERSA_13094 [Pseudocohnilembus persalinus]|uniref:Uncharacterized protein n=1 Tax=Pseudocohnilembus persalinus TaxID=266149 RepID=A0A0V0QWJ0_PSEPJ|nr:hypothetical protein PPERSA_13094 [Pseudocohnilembus persalinus]|eukprot:KRX06615.1 hypothetical protein PPERSA_13094 [Pseudocohnilembus persalinus]